MEFNFGTCITNKGKKYSFIPRHFKPIPSFIVYLQFYLKFVYLKQIFSIPQIMPNFRGTFPQTHIIRCSGGGKVSHYTNVTLFFSLISCHFLYSIFSKAVGCCCLPEMWFECLLSCSVWMNYRVKYST